MSDYFEIDMNSLASFRKMMDKMATAGVDIQMVMATIPSMIAKRVEVAVVDQGPRTKKNVPIGKYLKYSGGADGTARIGIEIEGDPQERAVSGGFSKGDFLLTGRRKGSGLIRPRRARSLKFRDTPPKAGMYGSARKSAVPGHASQVRAIAVPVVKALVLQAIIDRTGLGPRGGSKRVTTGGVRARDRVTGIVRLGPGQPKGGHGQMTPGLEMPYYRGPRG